MDEIVMGGGESGVRSSDRTLVGLLGLDARQRWAVPIASLLSLVAMMGINAVWSWGDGDPTLIGGWLARLAPLPLWAAGSAASLALVGVLGGRRADGERTGRGAIAWLLLAFLVGVGGSEWLQSAIPLPPSTAIDDFVDPLVWLLHRSFFLLGGLPVLLCWLWLRTGRGARAPLRLGDWGVTTRVLRPGAKKRSWRWHLVAWTLFPVVPFTLLFHAQSDFVLVTSGRLFVFLLPVVAMALFNAFAEELIFRGFLLPAFGDSIGLGAAVWVQAILFGLLHFGSSPAPLGAVAILVVATFIGLYFGKSVIETGGIAWALVAHALADFTFFSVQFISLP